MTDMETQRGDFGEWCINLFDVASSKRQDIHPERLWYVCCRAVEKVRPDLHRMNDVRDVAALLMECLFPMLKKEADR